MSDATLMPFHLSNHSCVFKKNHVIPLIDCAYFGNRPCVFQKSTVPFQKSTVRISEIADRAYFGNRPCASTFIYLFKCLGRLSSAQKGG